MSLVANIARVFAGRVTAQALTVATAPILTRLFLPEEFGEAALLRAVSSVAMPLFILRYNGALPKAKDAREAGALFTLCLGLAGVSAIGVTAVAWLGADVFADWLDAPSLAAWLPFTGLLLLLMTFCRTALDYAAWADRFGAVAMAEVIAPAVQRGTAMAWGFAYSVNGSAGAAGLLLALFTAPVCRTVFLLARLGRHLRGALRIGLADLAAVRRAASDHRGFPRYVVAATLVVLGSIAGVSVALASFYTMATVGLYSQAYALINLPVSLLNQSLARTFLPWIVRARHQGRNVAGPVRQVFSAIAAIAVVPMMTVALIGPTLFGWLLGARFHDAGTYARLMTPWVLSVQLFSPLSVLYNALDHERAMMRQNALTAVAQFVALLALGATCPVEVTLLGFSCVSAVAILGKTAWLLYGAGVSLLSCGRLLLQHATGGAAVLLPTAALMLAGQPAWQIVGAATLGNLAWTAWVVRRDEELRRAVGGALARLREGR